MPARIPPRIAGFVVCSVLAAQTAAQAEDITWSISSYEDDPLRIVVIRDQRSFADRIEQAALLQEDAQPRFFPELETLSPPQPSAADALPTVPATTSSSGQSATMRPVEATPTFSASSLLRENPQLSLILQRRRAALNVGRSQVVGGESITRVTTDAGSIFSKSSEAPGVATQQRNPIVNDVRIRGSQVGRLAASGSHWVPARLDLDTALSKIDSRVLSEISSVNGPYSVRYGPGYRHIAFEILDSPRNERRHVRGISGIQYGTNGEQWLGRQTFAVSDRDWGFRLGYRHLTGSDYRTGDGVEIPSSYNSRDWNLAWGRDWASGDNLEFHYLRLDQTNVELPGQAFDIDVLVTDGFDLEYRSNQYDDVEYVSFETWYNQTRFRGNAQNVGKRRQFPILDAFGFIGFTDVDSLSTGYAWSRSVGEQGSWRCLFGTDFRFVKQRLDEFSSAVGLGPFPGWMDVNSPIPKSFQSDPGLFVEHQSSLGEFCRFEFGARVDYVSSRLDDDIQRDPLTPFQLPLAAILGSGDFDQDFAVPTVYVTSELDLLSNLQMQVGAGYSHRPPNLTEMYAAEPFMFVLQNGLNTVTGDPLLDSEKMTQLDLGLSYETESLRWRASGFFGWGRDFITYENMEVVGVSEQVRLKYVNTEKAMLSGLEFLLEKDLCRSATLFSNFSYTRGTDVTRTGTFATRPADFGSPSQRVPGLPRGFFSGIMAGNSEPLPNIVPLESRLGIRLRAETQDRSWNIEMSARIVDDQHRVASSLLESTTPGFAVFDLRSYLVDRRGLRVVAGVENLTDKAYRNHLDFRSPRGLAVLQPGVNFYFGSDVYY